MNKELETLFCRTEPVEKEEDETVNHPKHYADKDAPCECIKVIHYITKDLNGDVAVGIGNLQKYIWRLGKKAPDKDQTTEEKTLEDMKKAMWYLDDAISLMEERLLKEKLNKEKGNVRTTD